MNKKLSIATSVLNFFISAILIAAAVFLLILLIKVAANFNDLGWGFIAGMLAIPFLGFGTLLFAGGGAIIAILNIKGLGALKNCDTKKLKSVTSVNTALAGAVCGICVLVVISCVSEAVTSAAGVNLNLLLYTLIPLTVGAASFILNFLTLKNLKNVSAAKIADSNADGKIYE